MSASAVANVDAVVVGAGFSGLYMVHRLRQAGFSVQGIEAGGGVGGTWYWNRYPGARCDIPSLLYSYTFSDELTDDWRWSEKYAPQPEILRYAEHVAERFALSDAFVFETKVTAAVFDETRGRWMVETDSGARFDAQFCIMGTGCLSVPREPDFKGVQDFKGESYVTGRWPHEGVDFTGKRVAVIGTGSSSIQSLPLIAKRAASVTVFQRTANFSLPALNAEVSEEERAAFKAGYEDYKAALKAGISPVNVGAEERTPDAAEMKALTEGLWNGMGLMSLLAIPRIVRDEAMNAAAAEYVRGKVSEIVKDKATAETLTPRDHPIGAKRACVDTDYYATFNSGHVRLVDLRKEPIERVTETGVRTADKDYPVDAIVYATGFDAMTGALLAIDIRGRDGVSLRDAWAAGPRTYLGLQVAGFPNLFTVTGPGSPSVLSNMLTSIEQHVDWIADALVHVRGAGKGTIEASAEAQDAWVAHVNEEGDKTLYPRANSWYLGANVPGKPRVFMPYVGEGYKVRIDAVADAGYEGFALAG